ncbi:Gfo/Idh/MocA family oxidoreductase [Asanoa sp. NPDC050611]|uniref:Gfo/Idh/MocA family oxidoreductase n=1 Tax=Asanoa sp. NPDC050611 TaxID=3157098 RepID=UPI0033D83106
MGTGFRAQLFTVGLASRPAYEVVALCDPSPTRMAFHNRLLTEHGRPAARTWQPGEFDRLLDEVAPDLVVVTSTDATHDTYIVPALRAGARVITEKAMTTDAAKARRVMAAVAQSRGSLHVAFNYRFNPVHAKVRELLAGGAIGEIGSVHFEWLLDVHHGADYFRRWHRERAHSGGLLVHKASHHFDLVNWWLGGRPRVVYGQGRLAFYGDSGAGARQGYARDYPRAHESPAAADDPFALHLVDNPGLRGLYLDAEADSGYLRDQNVFGAGITIEDDMAVLVEYDTGASMTYHLTAYSPWEGYRVMFNGSRGRLELEVAETAWTRPGQRVESDKGALHGDLAAESAGEPRILLRPLWGRPAVVDLPPYDHAGHGGGDQRMLAALLDDDAPQAEDRAGAHDGLMALLPGLAANESIRTGRAIEIDSLLAA